MSKKSTLKFILGLSPFEHHELPAPIASDTLVPAPLVAQILRAAEPLRDQVIRAAQILREVEQLRVVAQLLEDVDRRERLRVRALQERFDLRRRDEEPVQRELEVGEPAEDDLLIFYGHYLMRGKTFSGELRKVWVVWGTHDI